ncbi:MAG TPA: hypothetical protein VF074_20740 [Pyrinomonadaceae bacterium]
MSSKARQEGKRKEAFDDSVWNLRTIALLLTILICLSLFVFGIFKLREARVASIPAEFEGQIVEKWAGFSETQEGSSPYFRIVVEVDGTRFTVPVYKEIYEEAQVGMRLKRSVKGLQVISAPIGSTAVP